MITELLIASMLLPAREFESWQSSVQYQLLVVIGPEFATFLLRSQASSSTSRPPTRAKEKVYDHEYEGKENMSGEK